MAIPRVILVGTIGLFAVIGAAGVIKKVFFSPKAPHKAVIAAPSVQVPAKAAAKVLAVASAPQEVSVKPTSVAPPATPQVDRIQQLFTTGANKLPIVETITYSSQVPWLKGRPAWVGDYAVHFATSRHFIARSLNGTADYFTQKVCPGSKFNVFRKDKNFQFYLLVDIATCKMAFYYLDMDTNERVLLKTYAVGLGKKAATASGTLTPLGKYLLGDKIAVYRPGVMGLFQEKQVEMIRVFGTRWLPFGKELGGSANVKGYGIQGTPWTPNKQEGKWTELRLELNPGLNQGTGGCIHMNHEDIEELFAIVVTKPTTVEIVKNMKDAKLPGVEVNSPKR
ncbi:MAG TPA: L,D-transpeptidase [Rhabdochlamydiaceae bacterium]|jgi:lipoprotein-anchoring transpeptidase ErfK/SrfK|nr:L,D-transpeptidase [Rhabdochlamydiaceae bacterium]